jgi:hypothetical protein
MTHQDADRQRDAAFRYDAFISYSHADAKAAARVQRFLEGYRLPKGGVVSGDRLRVFRDTTDIRAGDLQDELKTALAKSRTLVVCCSNSAADSQWVRKEIEEFRSHGEDRAIVLILLSGEAPEAMPKPLRGMELRYSDLRQGWRLGLLRPKARVELVRALALIAGLDLRTLIPWDKRRRRRRAIMLSAAGFALLVAVLSYPLSTWQQLDVLSSFRPLRQVVSCQVAAGELVLASRYRGVGPQGDRNYVEIHQDVLNTEDASVWMENNYNPAYRLLQISIADWDMVNRALSALDSSAIREALDAQGDSMPDAVWIGEPRPGAFVAVFPYPLDDEFDEYSSPRPGTSMVLVHGDEGTHAAEIVGLLPPPTSGEARAVAPSTGLPIVWSEDEIWIGMSLRDDGGAGGLWHTSDDGLSWVQETGFLSVNSIITDPFHPGRLLVSEAPGTLKSGVHELKQPARLVERSEANQEWHPYDGPPYGANSEIELCGFLPDGTLIIRVDEFVYAKQRSSLFTRLVEGL